jgi:hypothetical protein
VLALRARQSLTLLAFPLLSIGTPMLDRLLLEDIADLHRFVREWIAYRRRRDVVINERSLSLCILVRRYLVGWHGVQPNQHRPPIPLVRHRQQQEGHRDLGGCPRFGGGHLHGGPPLHRGADRGSQPCSSCS